MPFFNHGLSSRSSSGTASNPSPFDALGGLSDNMNIAQGLLMRSRISQARKPSTSPSLEDHTLEALHTQHRHTESDEAGKPRRAIRSSTTRTWSSRDILYDREELEDRSAFVQEYNRIAEKHGVRVMVADDFENTDNSAAVDGKPRSWLLRKILKRKPAVQSAKPEKLLKHRRSISDISLRLKLRKDKLKNKSLPELVRLCGLSPLHFPSEYAAGNLAIPTCFRATAQYLIQHAPSTSGAFKVPGSHHIVEALYDHYCPVDENPDMISGTVRCPTLPGHIKFDVHDVASTFKKLLSGLPGGILGSLVVFDSFVAIQSQLQWDPKSAGTRQRNVLPKLIALAISTIRSQYRRELICAVFGLLCMVGTTAELACMDRESPLHTPDLMGYTALGIVFGPLLVGELLEDWNVHLEKSQAGLVLLPISPPKSKKRKRKQAQTTELGVLFNTQMDKIKIANGITEMIITHWRDVSRNIKTLASAKFIGNAEGFRSNGSDLPFLRTSISEPFTLRKPPSWEGVKLPSNDFEGSQSPTRTQCASDFRKSYPRVSSELRQNGGLIVKKQRSRTRQRSSHILSESRSLSTLSPTAEEQIDSDVLGTPRGNNNAGNNFNVVQGVREVVSNVLPCTLSPHSSVPFHTLEPLDTGSDKWRKPEEGPVTPSDEECVVNNTSGLDHAQTELYSLVPLGNQTTQHTGGENPRDAYPNGHNSDSTSSQEKLPQRLQDTNNNRMVISMSPRKRKSATSSATSDSRHEDPNWLSWKSSGKRIKLRRQPPPVTKTNSQEESSITEVMQPPPIKQPTAARHTRFRLKGVTLSLCTPGPISEINDLATQRDTNNLPELRVTMPRPVSEPMFPDLVPEYQWGSFKCPSKDPLSSVSQDEDLASLATLAQAMANEPPNNEDSFIEAQERRDPETGIHESPWHAQENGTDDGLVSNASNQANIVAEFCSPGLSPFAIQRKEAHPPRMSKVGPVNGAQGNYSPNLNNISSTTKSPSTYHDYRKDLVARGSSRGSVKALAARFDKPPSMPNDRTETESLSIDSSTGFESPRRLDLVAPYHASPTSPTKTEKSGSLYLTPRSNRNPFPVERNWKGDVERGLIPGAPSISQHISIQRSLGNSKSPQRRRNHSRNMNTPTANFAEGNVNSYSVSPKHIGSRRGSMPKHQGGAYLDRRTDRRNIETKAMSATQPSPAIDRMVYPQPPSHASNEPPANSTQYHRHFRDVSNKTQHYSQKASPRSPRNNLLLHSQIRALQLHIENMEAEMRRLHQHLDTRRTLDVGTLSAQLRETKWEMQTWKSRAEAAEKQIEVLAKVSARPRSTPRSSYISENVCGSTMDYQRENSAMADRTNRGFPETEDDRSAAQLGEFESSGTTIHDTSDAIPGNE